MLVAVMQFAPVWGDVGANLRSILAAAEEASRAGARIMVTPEMALTGWTIRDPDTRTRLARDVVETAVPALADAAKRHGISLVVGGPMPAGEPNGSAYVEVAAPTLVNAVALVGADRHVTRYRKIHLFGEERAWWDPGDTPAVGLVDETRVGITICYDAEFPEVPRMTRLAGCEVLVVAATNMRPYERDQDVLFATRAIENECPVVVANRLGEENGWTYFGRSLVLDQRGRVIAQAGSEETLLYAEVEPGGAGDSALAYIAQRRPEVYRPLVDQTP
jgi:5-aminopentanamidase